jgi:hypothetical protein
MPATWSSRAVRLCRGPDIRAIVPDLQHVPVNKGAGTRALSAKDIQSKFLANATLWLDEAHAESALEVIMCPEPRPVRTVMHTLRKQ